jgi:hypothetical protein
MKRALHTGDTSPTRPDPIQPAKTRPCVVCGRTGRVWGYVNHGNGVICSKECQEKYDEKFTANYCFGDSGTPR